MSTPKWTVVTANHDLEHVAFWIDACAARSTCPEWGLELLDGATEVAMPQPAAQELFAWAMRIRGFASALSVRLENESERQERLKAVRARARAIEDAFRAAAAGT